MKILRIKVLIMFIIVLLLSSAIISIWRNIQGTASLVQLGLSANDIEYIDFEQLTSSEVGGNSCQTPPDGFKSWTRGTVTKLAPVIHANCTSLFIGDDKSEIVSVHNALRSWPVTEEHTHKFVKLVKEQNCTHFKDELEDNFYITKDELVFPLAFTMVVHNSAFQIYRLLKVIYRPHNIYCIHYDRKSPEGFKLLFNKLARCFNNIIVPSNISEVRWGHHSLMDAQMNCFRDLQQNRFKYPWQYVITLCGKELPLRTNKEIVHLLKDLKGNSAIRALPVRKMGRKRFEKKWIFKSKTDVVLTEEDAGPVPYNLTMYKSMMFFALTPEFVNYTLNDVVALALAKFLRDAFAPEENFYSTLFMIPRVPGGYNANITRSRIPVVSDYNWITRRREAQAGKYCRGRVIVHNICIITSADLWSVSSKVNASDLTGPMFHNKYFTERDHTVMDCMEEQLVIRNKLEYKKECLT